MPTPSDAQNAQIEEGQFDDAPEDIDPRAGHAYIDEAPPDEDRLLEWSSESESGNDGEQDEFEAQEDALEEAAFRTLRAEDEDWEIAERGALHPVTPVHTCSGLRCYV